MNRDAIKYLADNGMLSTKIKSLIDELDSILEACKEESIEISGSGYFGKLSSVINSVDVVFDAEDRFSGTPPIARGIPLSEIDKLLTNQNETLAKHFGVSVKHFLYWKEAMISGVACDALTKQGTPCCGTVILNIPNNPKEFNPNKRFYCPVHKNNSMNIKSRKRPID